MENLFLIIYLGFWAYSVYYCRQVAEKLNYRKDVALLVALLLPVPAFILYAYYNWKAKNKAK